MNDDAYSDYTSDNSGEVIAVVTVRGASAAPGWSSRLMDATFATSALFAESRQRRGQWCGERTP